MSTFLGLSTHFSKSGYGKNMCVRKQAFPQGIFLLLEFFCPILEQMPIG